MADLEKQAAVQNDRVLPTQQTHHTLNNQQAPVMLGATPIGQALAQYPENRFRTFANPAPLGLMSFASTTLLLSLVNVQAHDVTLPEVTIGMALFVGGLAQFVAGMWEFAAANTLGATAFTSYGAFWMSYATLFIPGSGVTAAYQGTNQEGFAIGFYLATWFIFTFMMLIASLRSNWGLITLFFFLDITFLLLTIGQYRSNVKIVKAGGYFGIFTAFIAYYDGLSNMLTRQNHYFTLPLGHLPKRAD